MCPLPLNTIDRHAVCMATGQTNAEIMTEKSPTLVAGHEQPIVTHPQIAGTLLCLRRGGFPALPDRGNELDFCVMSAGFSTRPAASPGASVSRKKLLPTLLAGQQSAVMKACLIGGAAVMEAQTAAVDCRNLRETDEVSGTLLAKRASGGYSLNYQNPVRTGLCVRRLTPHRGGAFCRATRPGGRRPAQMAAPSVTQKRYQMLGNSIAVPCVAYIMQGITDAVNQACEKGREKAMSHQKIIVSGTGNHPPLQPGGACRPGLYP